jgi:DNA polymerase III subunit alpha
MTSFAEYAFNKSHAAAYAVIAYQTAYLKAYYPVEFLAALMTSMVGDSPSVAGYIRNAREMNIDILPPDVTKSYKHFSVENGKIRFGLLGVKNVGEGIIDAIIDARKKNPPVDIFEFIDRLDVHHLNKKAVESLIRAGALDSFPGNRAQKLGVFEGLIESAQNSNKKNLDGQLSLFSMEGVSESVLSVDRQLPPASDYDKEDLIFMEKDMLGVYISEHPLTDVADCIKSIVTMDTARLAHAEDDNDIKDGMSATMAGIVTVKKSLITKKGQSMAFMTLEDLYGSVEVVVFPKAFAEAREIIQEDKILVVKGKLDTKAEGSVKLLADKITLLADYEKARTEAKSKRKEQKDKSKIEVESAPVIKIVIPQEFQEHEGLLAFRSIAREFRGEMPVAVLVSCTGKKYKLDYDLWVDPTDEFLDRVRQAFGQDCIRP